jgi:lipoprotein-releasing system permease protein
MYKLLLSGRYLRTRFIALASIVSVTLGVATMIVVNSVMAGFSDQMKDRIRGILADIMVETTSTDGEPDPEYTMSRIQELVGEHVVAMTPTVEIYGLMTFEWAGETFNRPVTIIGILPEGKDRISPLTDFLQSRKQGLRAKDAPLDWSLTGEMMTQRKALLAQRRIESEARLRMTEDPGETEGFRSPFEQPAGSATEPAPVDPSQLFGPVAPAVTAVDPDAPQEGRVYVGSSLVSFPYKTKTGETETITMVNPGEDIKLSTIKVGAPDVVGFPVTVCDLFQSGMSEYDSQLVFCNLEVLQKMRGMLVQAPGEPLDWRQGSVTTIQIKLKDYADAPLVMERLKSGLLPLGHFQVRSWEQKQGPLLEAVEVESAILNVLLFLIIAVAGFGILAIFYMIVVEKTRDIGILKALGASRRGVMAIFLSYGLSLGVVGAGAGVALGLLFVKYINQIEELVSWVTGRKVFDETIYYFKEIPTAIHWSTVAWVAFGAMLIAVLASVLPARRAARLHPVQALRYE